MPEPPQPAHSLLKGSAVSSRAQQTPSVQSSGPSQAATELTTHTSGPPTLDSHKGVAPPGSQQSCSPTTHIASPQAIRWSLASTGGGASTVGGASGGASAAAPSALTLLDDEELHTILGHELGHIMSGHALYRTILFLILTVGLRGLPFLAGIALLPIQIALLEWYRKSELSCDRAGLLASQDAVASMRMFMKMAGGGKPEEMDLNAFMVQAKEYEQGGDAMDGVYKVLNTLFMTHPFHTLRAAELQRWVEGGDYDRILRGEYPKRGTQDEQRPIGDDFAEAGRYYADQAKEAVDSVTEVAKKAREAFMGAFNKGSGGR